MAPTAESVLEAVRRLNRATMLMIEGQYLDLTFEQRTDVSVDEYLAMVERKTGAMMGVSLSIGATLAGASAGQADALDRAGTRLGRCFQMRDDWLGIWADPDALGQTDGRGHPPTEEVVSDSVCARPCSDGG